MKASIIIPTFNRLWCLPEALASCPDDPEIEIIVIDDGSTDGTWDWLSTQRGRPGLRAVRQDNWGKPRAVNRGVQISRGRYIKFLDSDDLCMRAQFEQQLVSCLADEPDICPASYVERFTDSGEEVVHRWVNSGDFIAQQLGECDSSHYSAYLFRRDFILSVPHRPDFSYCDDRMFILECALKHPTILDFGNTTLVHRQHGKGRIQFGTGSIAVTANLQKRQMYTKIMTMLQNNGEDTDRRRQAPSRELYALAQRTSAYSWREGREIREFLTGLNSQYKPPYRGRNRLYRLLGFATAQLLVNMMRGIRDNFAWLRPRQGTLKRS